MGNSIQKFNGVLIGSFYFDHTGGRVETRMFSFQKG
jgi:hypothetical protein